MQSVARFDWASSRYVGFDGHGAEHNVVAVRFAEMLARGRLSRSFHWDADEEVSEKGERVDASLASEKERETWWRG
jgi:hypothetical protein